LREDYRVSDMVVTGNEGPNQKHAQSSEIRHGESDGSNTLSSSRNAAVNADAVQQNISGQRTIAARSPVWQHFTWNEGRAYCIHCSNDYAADTKIHGTSRLWKHLEKAHNIYRVSSS
jgi:hypothetical protein